MKTFILFTLGLTLTVSHLVLASTPEEEKRPNVKAMIKAFGDSIPITQLSSMTPSSSNSSLPSVSTESPKSTKRKISLSLKGSSGSIKKEDRSESPKKQQDSTVQSPPSSARSRGFSYTSLPLSTDSPSPRSSSPNLKLNQEETATSSISTSPSPESSNSNSPNRSRSKSKSSKSELILSRPVATKAFVTIKNPEVELEQLLSEAISLCGSVFEPIGGTEKDSNKKIDLVVKPMIDELKLSIKNISKKKSEAELLQESQQRAQLLGDPVSFFRMTVNRAQNQLPFAIKWAMGETLENAELEKYFTTMFQDAAKSEVAIKSEHESTQVTLMKIASTLYFSLLNKHGTQKLHPQYNQDRAAVVDVLLKEYTTYMNGMHDELKRAIRNAIAFNSLNRDFNLTIQLMNDNLLKALDWALGKEEKIDAEMLEQFNRKLKELTMPPLSRKTS